MSSAGTLINRLDSSISSFEGRVDGHINSVYSSTNNVHSTTLKIYESIQIVN